MGTLLRVAAQWLALTLALAAAMTRSAEALRDYVSPSLPAGALLLVAFGCGLLLGLGVPSGRALAPLVVMMCLVAAAVFGWVVYLPARQGLVVGSVLLRSVAEREALFMLLWSLPPALVGALGGVLLAGQLAQERAEEPRVPWWERRG